MKTAINLSDCGTYRYALWRVWDESLPYAMFIGFAPATGDEEAENPIMERYARLATEWGCGGICLVHMFSRLPDGPEGGLRATAEGIGPETDSRIASIAADADFVVGDWGSDGFFHNRGSDVMKMLPKLTFLPQNRTRDRLLLFARQAIHGMR